MGPKTLFELLRPLYYRSLIVTLIDPLQKEPYSSYEGPLYYGFSVEASRAPVGFSVLRVSSREVSGLRGLGFRVQGSELRDKAL